MECFIIVADAINSKIDRIIKTLENIKDSMSVSDFIAILEAIKILDIRINTDNEIYVTFKDKEIIRFTIERDVIQ